MTAGNTLKFNQETKRKGSIFLALVVAANLLYWGYQWVAYETYESCLLKAAKATKGMPRAYADLREICAEREMARFEEKNQVKPWAQYQQQELTDKQVGLFDDLPSKPRK